MAAAERSVNTKLRTENKWAAFQQLFAGVSAGIITTICTHPLDLIKTRMQIDRDATAKMGGIVRIAKQVYGDERSLLSFYRGLSPNMIGNAASWGFYFMWYGEIKKYMSARRGVTMLELSSAEFLAASGTAGIATAICTNPIWVVKTRMLITDRSSVGSYRGLSDGIRRIFRTEGVRGFYSGLTPSLIGVSHGAVQFMFYEELKKLRIRQKMGSSDPGLNNVEWIAASTLSKTLALIVTYPYQVLRSRLQAHNAKSTYSSARDAISKTYHVEGFQGFYKGLVASVIRVLPGTMITFLVYENINRAFET